MERWGNQGLAWCEVSLRVPPSPLIKQGVFFTRIDQTPTPPDNSSKALLAFLLGRGPPRYLGTLTRGHAEDLARTAQ